jgi:hypothetical protein
VSGIAIAHADDPARLEEGERVFDHLYAHFRKAPEGGGA